MSFEPKQIQSEISKYWKENNIVDKVREATEGNEEFILIDGPPYLNGAPHVGHMQGKVIKDTVLRFRQMQGYDVWDQAGFDTHGLPNELATEEELGIENKNDIGTKISAEEFICECRKRATSAQDLWKGVMSDLAIWQDFDKPYLTFTNDYIESEWWLVKKADEQGLLFQAKKPVHWCPRCQTSLSGYEVTDEYREVEDNAIFVKFPLANREESLVIWTTTPWTVPANMAIFVNPDYDYARVKVDGEVLIIANQLVDRVMEKAGYSEEDYEIAGTFKGVQIQGKKYMHPFLEEIPRQAEMNSSNKVHRVQVSEEIVTLEEGTGLVHAASGHGQEDYEEAVKIGIPVYSPVDKEGVYTEEAGVFEGDYVFDAEEEVLQRLEKKDLLFHNETFKHEYPHCWRCKTKLVYRAEDQWFIDNERVKERILEENESTKWVPDHVQKRFDNFVEKSPDWCISRQNYWGAPIPIWVCDGCGEKTVVGSYEELESFAGELPEDFDPHKHVVDKISWDCECGGRFERVKDILDVWFDSGCAPFASMHYPFEEVPEDRFPIDYITEASDQIRGWFYSLMFCGILGFDEAQFSEVLFQGHVLDENGKKMSKSLGNVIDPAEQVEKYGADIPRFYSMWVAAPWEQTKYDETEICDEIYRMFSVYYNTKEFFNTYVEEVKKPKKLKKEDKWVLSRLNNLVDSVEYLMEESRFHEFARKVEKFILNDLSRWYVKVVRDRIKKGNKAASWTLYQVLNQVNLVLAPIAPYTAEKVYQDINGDKESVHMESYPESEEKRINDELEESMEIVREVVDKAVKIRDENQYSLRWPVKKIVISSDDETKYALTGFEEIIKKMGNIDVLEFGEVSTSLEAKPDYSSIGPKFGADADKVAKIVEEIEHEEIDQLVETGALKVDGYELEEEDVEVFKTTSETVGGTGFSKGRIYLDLHMSNTIKDRAFVSEIIRAIQQERKDNEFEVEDVVDISFEGDVAPVKNNVDKVKERVNVGEISFGATSYKHSNSVEFKGRKIKFSFEKVGKE